MSDFDKVRDRLRAARGEVSDAQAGVAAARRQVAQVEARRARLGRVFDEDDEQHVALQEELAAERARLDAELQRLQDLRAQAVATEAGLLGEFAVFTDPRKGIGRLDDSVPILMMPVRLETRFKQSVAVPGSVPTPQLWIRVYPDDCWVDTFDEALTTSEVAGARAYWTAIWQAGGVEDLERGAWRTLATAHGSGRSAWIVQQYQPTNLAARPTKPRAEDVVLTVVVETLLPAPEAAAVSTFWVAVWLADGAAAPTAAARASLDTAVGAARAEELVASTVPVNLETRLPAGVAKTDVSVTLAFMQLPAPDPKASAWARPPRVEVLPDRFVFIGYETEGDTEPVVVVGDPVPSPLVLGPDPTAGEADQIQEEDGNLVIPDDMLWMTDFEWARQVGMGLVVDLTPTQASRGFARVLVIGLRLNADEHQAQAELEELLRHHGHRRTGMAVLPLGTPTNNTEEVGSGRPLDDPDASFDAFRAPLFTPTSDWLAKSDGQWLAEHLGVDPAVFHHATGAGGRDVGTARAMNAALWPATLGYWMETMLAPVFSGEAVEATRDFVNRFVVAGGACPSLRIGEQPYGVLPATAMSRSQWFVRRTSIAAVSSSVPSGYAERLWGLLRAVDEDMRLMAGNVARVGASGDPHALLLDIVGLHPGSVEWSQRYAESLATLFNRLNLLGLGGFAMALETIIERVAARQKLTQLGYAGEQDPQILDLSFSGRHNALTGGVVDDQPLSETAPLRATTETGDNYLRWLADAASTSLDALYRQQGFTGGKRPTALLYLFLRHALQLGYSDVSIRLFETAGVFDAAQAVAARADDPFLHIRDNTLSSESRYFPLYTASQVVTGSPVQPVHEYIAAHLPTLLFDHYLNDQLAALEHLVDRPTAQLERAFADHVDLCTYRLDAWLAGFTNAQVAMMRNLDEETDTPPRQGLHLGGYAWLEPLRPEGKVLDPVELADPDLATAFAGDPPLVHDATNQGYVHAPSLNHAVAAAVLRNGFLSDASPDNARTMAVNLTSERVRTALGMIEGIRAGQGLSSLLGYQLERGLHDRHGLAEVDAFIYKLRKAFPLRGDRFASTRTAEGVPIEAVEARNVVNGLALVEHVAATGQAAYPFGLPATLLPPATPAQQAAIDAEVDRLLEAHDAVADLALSEGVYQAVLGNYDRVASTYDAYARGAFPPEPDVVRTPMSGIGLTHRFALQLDPDASATTSPVGGIAMTPRAQAEPGLNAWLAGVLPDPADVSCAVTFRSAATGAILTREVTLAQVRLQPADLLAVVRDDSEQAMGELDDRVVRRVRAALDPRPDEPITVEYMRSATRPISVFETIPLVRHLRRLTGGSRALRSTDLTLMNEAKSGTDTGAGPGADTGSVVDKARLDLVHAAAQALSADIVAFLPDLEGPLSDLANRRDEILADADTWVDDLATLLARAATFAVPQAGWGFAYDFQHRTFAALLAQCADLVDRWDDRVAEHQAKRAAATAAATTEEKFRLLAQAEQAISTEVTSPLPATPALFETALDAKLATFQEVQAQYAAVADTTRRTVSGLLADVRALPPVDMLDPVPFALTDHEDEMVRFTQDAVRVAVLVRTELDRRAALAQDRFDDHDGSSVPAERLTALDEAARALLGEDFRVCPTFALAAEQGDELAKAVAASASGDLYDHLTTLPDPVDFPVDEWLYGIARVREKLRAWEGVVMVGGALGPGEPDLVAVQLPHADGDRWLGLEIPPDLVVDGERLLYTAHHAVAFDKSARQCGLLLDEWTETIPGQSVDTGIVFHHDRPNHEAPQAMLLVTPSDFRGRWQWEDLVDALNETLDLAKRRAVEPEDLDASAYAPFLPATVLASQVHQLTIAADLAYNNKIAVVEV